MPIEQILQSLDENQEVFEHYVLVREIKVLLDVGHESFHPRIRFRIYRSNMFTNAPYHFEVSHYVHTPANPADRYMPSDTTAESEHEAIRKAISTTTLFLREAIGDGHEPSEKWLVPNEHF